MRIGWNVCILFLCINRRWNLSLTNSVHYTTAWQNLSWMLLCMTFLDSKYKWAVGVDKEVKQKQRFVSIKHLQGWRSWCKNTETFWAALKVSKQLLILVPLTNLLTQKLGFEAWMKCFGWINTFCKDAIELWYSKKPLWQLHSQFREY